jgi:hypothetical protein
MKTITIIIAVAFTIISATMISLVIRGGALKPAGVIKPAEIGSDPTKLGRQIGVRLFPDLNAHKVVLWRVEDDSLAHIVRTAQEFYHGPIKPKLYDLRAGVPANCTENCWYLLGMDTELPQTLAAQTTTDQPAEIYIQYFDRDEKVPEACDNQKILDVKCMRPISVREVHRKLKTPAPYYFMQRYQKSLFFLYLERVR